MILQTAKKIAKQLGAKEVVEVARQAKKNLIDWQFDLDWKYLANPASTRRYLQEDSIPLTPLQLRILEDLNRHGVAFASIDELMGDEGRSLWQQVETAAKAFAKSEKVTKETERYSSEHGLGLWKDYIVKYYGGGERLNLEDPVLKLGYQQPILDVVNAYLKLYAKLKGANIWYTIPLKGERSRNASQNWHRDPEDRKLVKTFLYFNDINIDCGPFEYIPESRPGGKHANLWPISTGSGGYGYPPQNIIDAVPKEDRIVCTVPAGTIVFCDTSGIHRGGYAQGGERLMGTWIYVTPASHFKRMFTVDGDVDSLSPSAQEALT